VIIQATVHSVPFTEIICLLLKVKIIFIILLSSYTDIASYIVERWRREHLHTNTKHVDWYWPSINETVPLVIWDSYTCSYPVLYWME